MYSRILVAADGSKHSVRAVKHAIGLLSNRRNSIDVVYVVDENQSKEDVLHGRGKYEIKKERQEKLRNVIAALKHANIPYEVHILHGDPGPTIVQFANDRNYDCVVVGSRGVNQFQTMILGSVSHKIAKRVHSPVLIVK